VLPGPKKVSLPLQQKKPNGHIQHFLLLHYFLGLHVYIYAIKFSSAHFTMNFFDYSVLRTASFEKNDRDNGPLATLITVKDTFSSFIIMFFFTSFLWDLSNYFLGPHLSLSGPFTATLRPLTAKKFFHGQ
jgi:hypothetical protein